LKDLGIGLVGHRRALLDAIAALRADLNAKLPSPPSELKATTLVAAPAAPTLEAAGERRHVTVMFCDLVDSTGIAARLDAEEWRDLVGAYLDAASAAVAEMGGKVTKKLGDGLMALFGYPVAQENDAERAVRAALSIQRGLAELNRKNEGSGKPALVARIAIDLGPVVVDATGEIFGDVPNISARAQALAEPGSVVITARVQRQIAGLFVVEERGSHELKGVPEPVTLYRIVRASGAGRRAGQRHLTPLVGRDEEIALLMRRWERARQGDGRPRALGQSADSARRLSQRRALLCLQHPSCEELALGAGGSSSCRCGDLLLEQLCQDRRSEWTRLAAMAELQTWRGRSGDGTRHRNESTGRTAPRALRVFRCVVSESRNAVGSAAASLDTLRCGQTLLEHSKPRCITRAGIETSRR
jgi:class 3 adenylate cyclase